MSSGSHLSKELYELIKSIGETKSKEQEDRIIRDDLLLLKPELAKPNIAPKKMKELLIRALYIEMLGHGAEFAYIHAVNLTQNKNLVLKRYDCPRHLEWDTFSAHFSSTSLQNYSL